MGQQGEGSRSAHVGQKEGRDIASWWSSPASVFMWGGGTPGNEDPRWDQLQQLVRIRGHKRHPRIVGGGFHSYVL